MRTVWEGVVGALVLRAQRLGRCGKQMDSAAFVKELAAAGIMPGEAVELWKALVKSSPNGRDWQAARSNDELAQAFGIQLSNTAWPRNWMLYRLAMSHFRELELDVAAAQGGQVRFIKFPLDDRNQIMAIWRLYLGEKPAQFATRVPKTGAPRRRRRRYHGMPLNSLGVMRGGWYSC